MTGEGRSERSAMVYETLMAAQLARPEGPSGFVARHALLAEAVAAALLPGERSDLHAAVAGVLTERNDAGLAAEVAQHWLSSARPGHELPTRVEAAEYAESVYAFTLAADQLGTRIRPRRRGGRHRCGQIRSARCGGMGVCRR